MENVCRPFLHTFFYLSKILKTTQHKGSAALSGGASDHQQTPGRGMERERASSPFSIDFGGMYA